MDRSNKMAYKHTFFTNDKSFKNYHIAYHFKMNNNSGFGSICLQISDVDFNPFTINGLDQIRQNIAEQLAKDLSNDRILMFTKKVSIVILNVIPLEDEINQDSDNSINYNK